MTGTTGSLTRRQQPPRTTRLQHQNPYIEDEQTTQWLNEKLQKDKQKSTKHTHKTKDRVQQTPLKTRG
jgi:hypothetical protein